MKNAFRTKKVAWICAIVIALTGLGIGLWRHYFHEYTPVEVALDVRAGIAAKDAANPVERFLELRYGPLTEAANRQKAFLDFFNAGHIEGLQILVSRMDEKRRSARVAAMAEWIANYRATMTAEEKKSLAQYLRSDPGRRQLQQATTKYLGQDVRYRAATAPVITEIMTTLNTVQNQ